jgi:hypothetical protein
MVDREPPKSPKPNPLNDSDADAVAVAEASKVLSFPGFKFQQGPRSNRNVTASSVE